MTGSKQKNVLVLGANSDVAKACIRRYIEKGYFVMAASRNLAPLEEFINFHQWKPSQISLHSFDALDFEGHTTFYQQLPHQPHIVVYVAGFLVQNPTAFQNFEQALQMIHTNYVGAVSILNIISQDTNNKNLERIIGLSSLSGVRGRKSNFIYGSTKAAFTHYLEGLRQELSSRKIIVNAMVLGYIDTKINQGLSLNKKLMMQPDYVAEHIVNAGDRFILVPNWKWKLIYSIVKFSPGFVLAKLP